MLVSVGCLCVLLAVKILNCHNGYNKIMIGERGPQGQWRGDKILVGRETCQNLG